MARNANPGANKKAPAQKGGIKPADFMSALARGIMILKLFTKAQPEVSTTEAAEQTGLSRAAARRALLTLTELGYLKNDGEHFWPTPKVLELGYSYLSAWNFREIVQPFLQDVVYQLHENCSFAVLDETEVVYLARAEVNRIVQSISISVGTRVPASVSALGRILIAYLPEAEQNALIKHDILRTTLPLAITDPVLFSERLLEIRENGFAIVEGEFELGLISLAVPVFAPDGRIVAAINVGTSTTRANAEQMEEVFLPVLKKAAHEIGKAFEMRPDFRAGELSARLPHK